MAILVRLASGLLLATALSACSGPDLRCVAPATPSGSGESVLVPAIDEGTSVDDALQRLSSVGLEGCTPLVDFPHYTTGTDPAAGTTVSIGSRVTLEVGDG